MSEFFRHSAQPLAQFEGLAPNATIRLLPMIEYMLAFCLARCLLKIICPKG
ncbi:hypothetical protein ACVWY3_007671 [Bradyrhizobium sp. USDA 4486]